MPFALKQQLGLPDEKRKPRTAIAERKQRRQDLRKGHANNGNKRRKIVHQDSYDGEHEVRSDESEHKEVLENLDDDSDVFNEDLTDTSISISKPSAVPKSSRPETFPDTRPSRSRSPVFDLGEESDDLSRGSREYSPEVVLDANAKSFRDKQAEEDAEILVLERRLGKKSKSSSKVIDEEFGALLTGLVDNGSSSSSKRQDQKWLRNKRNAKAQVSARDDESGDEELETDMDSDAQSEQEDADEFFGFGDEDSVATGDEEEGSATTLSSDDEPAPVEKRQRENPYIAPVAKGSDNTTAKYIPPSRRNPPTTDTEILGRLRRQAQGTLNKLSEANIISIVTEFEKLYQTNPRQDVTTVTLDLLLAAFAVPSTLQSTFIILHAAFLAALYKILGADFGAEAVSRLVEAFDKYRNQGEAQGKETVNLVGLLANLYTFGVISSGLVYDHIRLLLTDFTENDAELLLRILRDCGPQLRSDDASALKSIVQMMNEVSARIASRGRTISIRTRVMMDTITDLKNNKVRQATNAAGATGEHLTRMRKALGSLNARQLRATEPLGITRLDITNGEKKGKWWLVGASWKGPDLALSKTPELRHSDQTIDIDHSAINGDDMDPESVDYNALSRHYKFTTPTHRSIFTAILSATDATDALQRVSKLRLTRKQEAEIPRVLLRICRAEPTYNPYYAVLARLLLRDGKRYKFAFEVALWKFFEEIGERSEEEESQSDSEGRDGEPIQAHEIANVANLYAALVARQVLTIDVLKTLNIGFLKENASLWLEMFFIAFFGSSKLSEKSVVEALSSLRPDMATGIAYFLRKEVRKSDLLRGKEEKRRVKHGVQMAEATLAAMAREGEELE